MLRIVEADTKGSSLGNFDINQPQDRMPEAVIKAFGVLKCAAATVNMNFGLGKNNSRRMMVIRQH